jgi:hypothetical protein
MHNAFMAKTRTSQTIEDEFRRAVKVRAARTGKSESHVIEEAGGYTSLFFFSMFWLLRATTPDAPHGPENTKRSDAERNESHDRLKNPEMVGRLVRNPVCVMVQRHPPFRGVGIVRSIR